MLIHILYLLIGLAILIGGAEFLVRGSASIAKRFGISPLVIGLTIVAFGTSMPELIVNIFSAIRGSSDIAIGNVIGSNIANILLILGISATIIPLRVAKSTVWKEIPLALLAVILVFVMGNDIIFDGAEKNMLSRTDGLLLMSMFIIFMYYSFSMTKQQSEVTETEKIKTYAPLKSILLVAAGLLALFFGGKFLVDQAIIIARLYGISESIIGLTIVAVGTSLPELATSVIAALHKHYDLAVGNIIGSNIFNIFWILGLTSTILPLPFIRDINIDLIILIAITFFLFVVMFIGKKHVLERWQGIIFILCYVTYIIYLVIRG